MAVGPFELVAWPGARATALVLRSSSRKSPAWQAGRRCLTPTVDGVVEHAVERLPERRHRFLARGAAAIGHAVALVATKSPGAQTTRRGSATSVTRAREPGKRR
jgi:hypothetical protein